MEILFYVALALMLFVALADQTRPRGALVPSRSRLR